MKDLRAVQALSSGVEELLPVVHRLPGRVVLCNAQGVHAESTAELALTLTPASLRGVPDFTRAQDLGLWRPRKRPSLHGRSVLIMGYGALGSAVEDLLAPFRCEVTRIARRARGTPRGSVHPTFRLPDLAARADIVVLSTELTPRTRHLINGHTLARMKDGALLVNVSRGAVIDTKALLGEVRSGRLRAALDVSDPEPLPADHPLWSAPNVLITPHSGALTNRMWPSLEDLIRRQIWRFARDEELINVVSPTSGSTAPPSLPAIHQQ